jgi:hypothetical protein
MREMPPYLLELPRCRRGRLYKLPDGLYMLPSKKCDSTIPKGHFSMENRSSSATTPVRLATESEPTNVYHALSPEIFRLNKEFKCIDCTKDYKSNKETCSYVVEVRLVDAALKTVNSKGKPYSQIGIRRMSPSTRRLSQKKSSKQPSNLRSWK